MSGKRFCNFMTESKILLPWYHLVVLLLIIFLFIFQIDMDYLYIDNVWLFCYRQSNLRILLFVVGCVLKFEPTYCYHLYYYNTPLNFTYSWASHIHILLIGYHVLPPIYGRFPFFACATGMCRINAISM